jgi:transcription-repair coupling factor (superfamily II helicase)
VGRGAAQAYAYFFTDRRHRPTPEGRERLETIAEQTELGAGYSIAMRDLEMRGAGDLLGPRQSGHISAVGFHLYTRLLGEAVKRLKSEVVSLKSDIGGPRRDVGLRTSDFGLVSVDLPLPTSIPAEYVADRALRLQLYRRLAHLSDEADVAAMGAELVDRFGPLPRPAENLLYQLQVKLRALRAGVVSIASENGQVVLALPPLEEGDYGYLAANLDPRVRVSRNRIWLPRATHENEWRAQLLEVLAQLAAVGRIPTPA